jgi:hypothetical protein
MNAAINGINHITHRHHAQAQYDRKFQFSG